MKLLAHVLCHVYVSTVSSKYQVVGHDDIEAIPYLYLTLVGGIEDLEESLGMCRQGEDSPEDHESLETFDRHVLDELSVAFVLQILDVIEVLPGEASELIVRTGSSK